MDNACLDHIPAGILNLKNGIKLTDTQAKCLEIGGETLKGAKGATMFEQVVKQMRSRFESLPDHRKGGNNTRYQIVDAVLSAFSVFMMQSPSFLAHQRDMQRQKGRDNVQTLFGVHAIPSDNQIRNLLDPIEPQAVGALFWDVYEQLEREGLLAEHRGIHNNLLCGMDGTQYFSSTRICCEHCTQRERDGKSYYSHNAIIPVLVAPERHSVFCLEPEFMVPQDGSEKQDCEQNAFKRWVQRHAHRLPAEGVTMLADDLHSKQPTCEVCLAHKLNFIFVCLPNSHPTLYAEIELLERIQGVNYYEVRHWNQRIWERHRYRYVNQVPLRSGADALRVNWCELTIVAEKSGESLYFNQFITNHLLDDETVSAVVASGRARWKTENESHNVLKNYGYHLEHNFGHGKQFLASLLLSLNLLAFLLHTLLDLTDTLYQQVRRELGTRKTFFNDIRTLTRYMIFDSWQHLLSFMFIQLELDQKRPP
jgi:hypothetical protein